MNIRSDEYYKPIAKPIAWAGLLLLASTAIVPLVQHGIRFFGYDIGFYRHYLLQPLALAEFPRPPAPLLTSDALGARLVLDLLQLLPFSADTLLIGSAIIAYVSAGLIFSLLCLALTKSKLIGALALVLFSTSFTQFVGYEFFLWKQALAIPLLLASFYFLQRNSWIAVLTISALLVTHRTTSIVFVLTVLPYAWVHWPRYRRWVLVGFFLIVAFVAWWQSELVFLLRRIALLGLSAPDYFTIQAGSLFSPLIYLKTSMLALGLTGHWLFSRRENFQSVLDTPLFWLGIISGIWVLGQFPFYERWLIFLDLAVLFFAAQGAAAVLERLPKKAAPWLLFLGLLPWGVAVSLWPASISPEFFSDIKTLHQLPSNATILVPSTRYAPWVYGWSERRVAAPGLFADRWTQEDWLLFWTSPDGQAKRQLLRRYPEPLFFLATPDEKLPTEFTDCTTAVSPRLYQMDCP